MIGKYIYETHCHTSETSKCARTDGAAFARFFKARGYSGIFITDHFFGANVVDMPESMSWKEKVDRFCLGYENAKQEGDRIGIDVFFGWEFGHESLHLLTYGLDKQWLYENPDIVCRDYKAYCDKVHGAGGFIVNAHPFRDERGVVRLMPYDVDAVEAINGAKADNTRGGAYADMMGLPKTAGSDIHWKYTDRNLAGVISGIKFTCVSDYIKELQNRNLELFEFPAYSV